MIAQQNKAQQALPEILKKAAGILAPRLHQLMVPSSYVALTMSFHIQDGVLNHIKDTDDPQRATVPAGSANGPKVRDVPAAMKQGLRVLQSRLEYCLVSGYHGVVILAFDIEDGVCTMATCGGEQVHKVASGKIPT